MVSRTLRLRKDAESLKDGARNFGEEGFSHPAAERIVEVIRGPPVTAFVVAVALTAPGARILGHARHLGD